MNPKGKKIKIDFSIFVAKASDKYPAKAFINAKSVEVLESNVEKAEKQDLTAGWGSGA